MKNTIKVLCIIAVVTMISLSMTACDEGFDNTPKTFNLSGLTTAEQGKVITVALAKETSMGTDRKSKLHAYNFKTLTAPATSLSMPLLTARDGANSGEPYQGSGSDFYLYVFVDKNNNSPTILDDDDVWYYTGGGGGILKFSIKYGVPDVNVNWNEFAKQP